MRTAVLEWRIEEEHHVTVVVGHQVLEELDPGGLGEHYSAAVLVADSNAPRWGFEALEKLLRDAVPRLLVRELPGGEPVKKLETVIRLWEWMAGEGVGRDALIVAYGGGAILDTVGFTASAYMRGVDWASVPTTLLAMADAGIGGKTGVNLGAKNLVGAFHHPRLYVADTGLLDGLPRAELLSGLGEVAKHTLLAGGEHYEWLLSNAARVSAGDLDALGEAVARSITVKMEVVSRDPRETRGERVLLNLGHTVGHAIEAASGYRVRHGIAVSMGLYVEALAAKRLIGESAAEETRRLLEKLGLPTQPPSSLDPGEALRYIALDKKRRGDRILLPLLRAPGDPVVAKPRLGEALEALEDAWREALHG